ncbi:MAG: Stp1/IreP family PP2C-type Ser/Thr phosphatase [Chloroflexi bacterium]|nr:Stp1/IreP family PP2C-type Ser/Thr phosphatase [Chloroflexota bacterium]
MITCPACGKQNRSTAKFCKHCGADLSPTRALNGTRAAKTSHTHDSERPAPSAPQPIARLTPLQSGSTLFDPLDPHRKYSIVVARELSRSIYYDALDLTCLDCGGLQSNTPQNGLCQQCQTPLRPVLIHERRPISNNHISEADITQLIRLSTGHSDILPHQAIIQYEETVYTVVEHPGRWGVLVRGQQQRSPEEALAGAAQIGQALAYLHDYKFSHSEVGGTSIENLIVVGGEKSLKLADLSTCARLQSNADDVLRAQVNGDVAFLAWLLFYLSTDKELSRADIELAPAPLRPIVERAMQRQYASVQGILTDFSLLPAPPPPPTRSLKPSHGQATHPGKKHPHNEDSVVTFTFDKEQKGYSVPVSFYLVADGMGGHQAGDLASRTVNQIVTNWIIQTKVLPNLHKATHPLSPKDMTGEMLTQAIQQANEALVDQGQTANSDMGSTVTAALIIGDVATITNVGDSRTYLLRDGRLEQITQDHSLVARLVDAGVIKPEDVRSHPQRNQIYRCLGHKSDVEVDTFMHKLQVGDVLVLCSDGLWEMVLDDEIQCVIETTRSPQKACDALIEAANRAGGKDNIAVIIVEME